MCCARDDQCSGLLTRWEHEWRPQLATRLAGLWQVDRSSLSDTGLDGHFGAALDLYQDALRIHFVLQGAIVLALGELSATSRELLGWDDRTSLELLNGLSTTSTQPAVRLWELAQLLRGRPGQMAALETLDAEAMDAEFGAAVRTFQDEFGRRALSLEFADPTLSEDPALLVVVARSAGPCDAPGPRGSRCRGTRAGRARRAAGAPRRC